MEKFAGQPIDTLADSRRFVPTFLLFIVKLLHIKTREDYKPNMLLVKIQCEQ